jgi:hypothetical protein
MGHSPGSNGARRHFRSSPVSTISLRPSDVSKEVAVGQALAWPMSA